MSLASISPTERGAADQLLAHAVSRLRNEGVKVLGALRDFDQMDLSKQCDSALRILPDGPVVRITQDLGAGSTACKMDAGALEDAVGIAVARLEAEGADLVVLNKFGLREAEGHGFRPLIANALARGIPVILGVSDTHRAAFDRFADGTATTLNPDEEAILTWCKAAIASPPNVVTG